MGLWALNQSALFQHNIAKLLLHLFMTSAVFYTRDNDFKMWIAKQLFAKIIILLLRWKSY